jgi:hypothetical protein
MIRRTVGSIIGSVLVFGFALGGCGGDNPADSDHGNASGTGGGSSNPEVTAPMLAFVTSEGQTLQFGQTVDLTVRYYDGDTGKGIADAPISYTLVGDSAGSKLAALKTMTDAAGEARMALTAGQQNGSFSVEVAPPSGGGSPISFQIVVSDQPVGSLSIGMTYLGALPLANLQPQLHKGIFCDGLDPNSLPAPFKTTGALGSIEDTTGWDTLAVGTDYAVTVTGQVGPNIRAYGCVDGVSVAQSETTKLQVPLADLYFPGPVLGTYDLVNQLDFGGQLPGSVQGSVDLLDELTDDQDIDCNLSTQDYGQDPGAFLTDFVMRQTCHWECLPGEDYDTCSEVNHSLGDIGALCQNNMMVWEGGQPSFFGGCGAWEIGAPWLQEQINSYVAQNLPGGALALTQMAGDLARAINKAKIHSVLTVQEGSDTNQPMTHKLVEMEVLLHDMQGNEHTYRFDLADAGLTSLQTNAALSVTGDQVTIPLHQFELSYGKLVQHVYLYGLLPLFGYQSTGEMFASWVDCTAVGQWLSANLMWVPVSAQGWKNFCQAGIQLAGDTFDTKLAGAIEADGVLELEGTCTASDIDPVTNIAKNLTQGNWVGAWGEGAESGSVTGTFVGSLR